MRRCGSLLVAAVLAFVLSASGCVPTDPVESRTSDTVTVVLGSPASTLIPYTPSVSVMQVDSLVFQSLVSVDASGRPQADLAAELPTRENGGVSADGRTVTFRLDSRAKWHDGKSVTAADVVFTARLVQDGVLPSYPPSTWRRLEGIDAVDESTVRMTFSEPDYPGALRLVPYVLPQHLLADSKDFVSDAYWDKPVGSGPYRVERVVRRKAVTLSRVSGEGPRRVQCVFNDTAEDQRRVWDGADRAVWPDTDLQPIGSETLVTAPSAVSRYFLFNTDRGHLTADKTVREAIAALLVSTEPTATTGLFGLGFDRSADTATAVRLLESAGWRKAPKSMRRKGKQDLTIDLAYKPESEADGYAIGKQKDTMQAVGVTTRIDSNLKYGDFNAPDATLIWAPWDVARVYAEEGEPFGYALQFERGDAPSFKDPGGLNLGQLEDRELDRISKALRMPISDSERQRLRHDYARRLAALTVVIPDRSYQTRTLVRGVDGVQGYRSPSEALRGITDWRVPAAK